MQESHRSRPEQSRAPVTGPAPDLARVVDRNIDALLRRRHEEQQQRGGSDRLADRVTAFTGSMLFVVLHLLVFGAWTLWNSSVLPVPRFDPTFVILATVASVEAIFLSTFVLISQNRMQALADERADLDLQVVLLTEHEVTKLITLVTAVADHLGLSQAGDEELSELARDVAPERVLDEIASSKAQLS